MIISDRELLEMAAKAAGYQIEWVRNSGCHYRCEEYVGREQWCPLDDDGDALRLAVRVGLDITFYNGYQEVHADSASGDQLSPAIEQYGEDRLAATRRAIVRAAAEIGRSME